MSGNIKANSRALLILSTGMLLATSASITSMASADEQLRTETILFQDLNVQTPAGAQALYRRIHAAAHRVCSISSDNRFDQLGAARCAQNSAAKVVEQLNLPALTAYYNKISGGKRPALVVKR